MGKTSDVDSILDITRALDVFEEGLFVPMCKLFNQGVPNNDVLDSIRYIVRTPELVLGDIQAQIGISRMAGVRVTKMLDEHGLDGLSLLAQSLQDRSERAMREAIAVLPDGEYQAEIESDRLSRPV